MLIIWIGIGAFLLMGLQYIIYQKFWRKGLKATCRFETQKIQTGETGRILLVVENNKRLPLPMLKVKFSCSRNLIFEDMDNGSVSDKYYRNDIFAMMPRQRITRRLKYTCKKRGYYEIGNLDVLGSDIFLSAEWGSEYPSFTSMYVYPRPYYSREMQSALQRLNGDVATKRHTIEDPFEYRGIRPYEAFDERKSINWKATARTGDFKVNIKGYSSFQEVKLLLNLEDLGVWKQEDLLELAIRIASALAENFLAQGIRVSFATNGIDTETESATALPASSGAAHLDEINRVLTMIDLTKPVVPFAESLYPKMEEGGSASFPILISKEISDELQGRLGMLMENHVDFSLICPQYAKREPVIQKRLMAHYIPIHYEDSL